MNNMNSNQNATIVNLPKLTIIAALWLVVPLVLAIVALVTYVVLQVNPDLGQANGVGIVAWCICVLATVITAITIGG